MPTSVISGNNHAKETQCVLQLTKEKYNGSKLPVQLVIGAANCVTAIRCLLVEHKCKMLHEPKKNFHWLV